MDVEERPISALKAELIDGMIDSRTPARQRNLIIDTLSEFPVEFLKIASDSEGKIRPLRDNESYGKVSPILRSVEVDNWPVPPAGMFVSGENTVYLNSVDSMTIAHEFGHLLDRSLGNGIYRSGIDQGIRSAFESATEFVTPYSASGLDEFFAEALRSYVGVNSEQSLWPRVSPARLAEVSPVMSAFFDNTIVSLRDRFAEQSASKDIAAEITGRTVSVGGSDGVIEENAARSPGKQRDRGIAGEKTTEAVRSDDRTASTPKPNRELRSTADSGKKPAAKDVYRQEITDKVIAAMKDGSAPWQKGWSGGEVGAPYNDTSKKLYRGGNIVRLMLEGRSDPRWMTIKQATEKGYDLRKGEASKGVWVEYWDHKNFGPPSKKDANEELPKPRAVGDESTPPPAAGDAVSDEKTGKEPEERAPFRRMRVFYSTVYNAEQLDGVPKLERKEQAWEAIGVWETVKNLLTNAGVEIKHDGGGAAFYSASQPNAIHLPEPRFFDSEAELASTALHEGVHWTSHKDRVDRVSDERGRFGSPSYARGELVAEMGAAIMAATMGLPRNPDNSAAYVAGWIEVLNKDKNALFQAATAAQEAVDFIIDRALEKTQEQAEQLLIEGGASLEDDLTRDQLVIGVAINSLPIHSPRQTDIVQVREDQRVGGEQAVKILGRSSDGERVFGQAGGSVLSLDRETFVAPPQKGEIMNVRRIDGHDVVDRLALELTLER